MGNLNRNVRTYLALCFVTFVWASFDIKITDKTYYQTKTTFLIDDKDISRSLAFSERTVESLKRLEANILSAQIGPKQNPRMPSADIEAAKIGKHAYLMEKATGHLINRFCYKSKLSKKCARQINDYNVTNVETADKDLLNTCYHLSHGGCPLNIDSTDEFRTHNGACNHKSSPSKGSANTPYKRLLYSAYIDGVHIPKRSNNNKVGLPSARTVTNALIRRENEQDNTVGRHTLVFAHWGEFLEHDMARSVPNKMIHFDSSIDCCTMEGNKLAPRYVHPFCQPITIEDDDKFFGKPNVSMKCLNYVRSMSALRDDCSFGPIGQLNQATHFLDLSHVYGVDQSTMLHLRNGIRGQMRTSNKYFLPKTTNDEYEAGDSRVNSNLQLATLHTVFIREHNRIAEQLSQLNPHWDDNRLYEETRRILIALMQHITYEEWLPRLLTKQQIMTINNAKFQEFQDPSVSNAFATAAMRFTKSLIRHKSLKFNLETDFDSLLKTLITQKTKKLDLSYAQDLIDNKVSDVISLDVQRGRDHGLPSYNSFRKLCGKQEAHVFDDLLPSIPGDIVKALSELYKTPSDIDLIIGGLSESPKGSKDEAPSIGDTFSCLIAEQFKRTQEGDRYFYTFDQFTVGQLAEIKKVTLAKLLCNNAEVEMIQPKAFLPVSKDNQLIQCNTLEEINLEAWKTV